MTPSHEPERGVPLHGDPLLTGTTWGLRALPWASGLGPGQDLAIPAIPALAPLSWRRVCRTCQGQAESTGGTEHAGGFGGSPRYRPVWGPPHRHEPARAGGEGRVCTSLF